MIYHEYNVINADNQQIRKIATGKKDIATASAKLRYMYGNKAAFLRLEYNCEKTMKNKLTRMMTAKQRNMSMLCGNIYKEV